MKLNKVINGDCLEVLKSLEENSIDSIVTDPPYELGFMGKSWDNTGIAYNAELWKQCLRVLKPGGNLLAFSGTRTYHRMAVAIEDAGFEVRDMIEWVYGSGFPKSLNIGKAVDKLQGNEREVVGEDKARFSTENSHEGWKRPSHDKETFEITKGNSPYEGWGTALKPAHEPICMARKPLAEKTVAENCLKWKCGGLNIDVSRVEHNEPLKTTNRTLYIDKVKDPNRMQGTFQNRTIASADLKGRFPANLIHDNSEEVRDCFPESSKGWGKASNGDTSGKKSMFGIGGVNANRYDMGGESSARFFKSILYYPKASKSERNKGCEELEEKPLAFSNQEKAELKKGNKNFDGGGSKGHGNQIRQLQNNHPTVKPIALMEYLIKMVTFEVGVVLDPFAGSGTTLIAAKKNGYQYIGIEKESEYIEIINARLNDAQLNIFEL